MCRSPALVVNVVKVSSSWAIGLYQTQSEAMYLRFLLITMGKNVFYRNFAQSDSKYYAGLKNLINEEKFIQFLLAQIIHEIQK